MKKEKLQSWLAGRIAREIGIDPALMDSDAPLLGYFMNGFQSARVVPELEKYLGRELPDAVLYERPTIAELTEFLAARPAPSERPRRWSRLRPLAGVWGQ